ncbi:carbamate kinase [Salmonella enterica subsp. arizonae]|uniref:Carbamate kinase n=1 Tax=Salmonella enterica subsp. arizonae TaxID=59203 RepID=A0A379T0F6_SALER|nr:carbamate kinase [Salmonella enterica subsp. arizonae]
MENKRTLVVALGGNALLKRGEPLEADIQRKNIELAAKTIAQLTQQWRVVLVHGNGPQVGLLALQNSAYASVTPYPLDILGAESQGMIGYMLQQALKNQLPEREISVLLTPSRSRCQRPGIPESNQIYRTDLRRSAGPRVTGRKGLGIQSRR